MSFQKVIFSIPEPQFVVIHLLMAKSFSIKLFEPFLVPVVPLEFFMPLSEDMGTGFPP